MTLITSLESFDLSQAAPALVRPPYKSHVTLPKGFPEAKLFSLLKALFGPPNGVMSLAIERRGDPDAPFKYEYVFKLPDDTSISVMRSWLNLEVHGIRRTIRQEEMVRMFTHNFTLHADKVEKALNELEIYRLVINPHARHRRMMLAFEKELKQLNVHEPDYPESMIATQQEIRRWQKQVKTYLRNMHTQNALAVSVVMESAYTAESLLNMFIAVLKKPILSSNANLLEDALREKWRDKLLRLPLHCDHMARTPDPQHPAVKGIARVFDRRNQIAHSYPDADDLCAAKIWYDNCIPILPNCGPYVSYQLGVDALLPRPADALECPLLVAEFAAYMYSLLDSPTRQEMEAFCKSNPIGFSEKTRRYGVPFGDGIYMSLFPKN
jgi:hypothetical protein